MQHAAESASITHSDCKFSSPFRSFSSRMVSSLLSCPPRCSPCCTPASRPTSSCARGTRAAWASASGATSPAASTSPSSSTATCAPGSSPPSARAAPSSAAAPQRVRSLALDRPHPRLHPAHHLPALPLVHLPLRSMEEHIQVPSGLNHSFMNSPPPQIHPYCLHRLFCFSCRQYSVEAGATFLVKCSECFTFCYCFLICLVLGHFVDLIRVGQIKPQTYILIKITIYYLVNMKNTQTLIIYIIQI